MLQHYLGKLKIQIFCRYLAVPDMEENANKLHFVSPLTLLFIPSFNIFGA